MYDVCIVGAGPAGATLARMIGARHRVLLVDRSPSRPKLCGGLLAPSAQRELARQGLGLPSSLLGGPQLFAVRTIDHDADLERLYQRFYVNVDRHAFDRWLVSLVPSAVRLGMGWTLTGLEREPAGAMLHFRTAQQARASVRARLVVGADGAHSLVRRLAFAESPAPVRYAAIQARFACGESDPYYGAIFDAGLTDFYGWTIPKDDGMLVGAALPLGPGLADRFDEFVRRVRGDGFGLGDEVERAVAQVARPLRPSHLRAGDDSVLLIGEAAGLISPSSAEGISYALRSGAALARALEPGFEGVAARYREALAPVAVKVASRLVKASAIYAAPTRRALMRSGVGALRAGASGTARGAAADAPGLIA